MTLPVTKICSGPCLRLPDLSFFADITMVIKIPCIQVPAQHYIYMSVNIYIYKQSVLQAALISISIKYLFPVETKVALSLLIMDKKTFWKLCTEVERGWNPNILILTFKLKITKPIIDMRNQTWGINKIFP